MKFRAFFDRLQFVVSPHLLLYSTVWLLGLIVGLCCANAYAYNLYLSEGFLVSGYISFIGLVAVTVLPIVLVGISLLKAMPFLTCLVISVEAVCRGYCGALVFLVLGGGAWVARIFILFSSACASVIMWWLIFRHRYVDRQRLMRDILIGILLAVIVSAVDIILITPFLSELFLYIKEGFAYSCWI